MHIYGGSSNRPLVEQIAKLGAWDLGVVESTQFANGERKLRVGQGSGAAVVVQSLSQPVDEHLMEFCLLCDALSRSGYTAILGVIPWLGYAKQDKVFLPGEPLSAQVVAQIIQTTKITKLITFDLHKSEIARFFAIPVVELSAVPLFLDYFHKNNMDKVVVVAPDTGAIQGATALATSLGVSVVTLDKARSLETGTVEIVGIRGEVGGKQAIVLDDMIVTGATVMASATYLKKRGAKKVTIAATHHLWVPGVQAQLEKSEVDEIVVTDTVSGNGNQEVGIRRYNKLRILSVAQLLVDELLG